MVIPVNAISLTMFAGGSLSAKSRTTETALAIKNANSVIRYQYPTAILPNTKRARVKYPIISQKILLVQRFFILQVPFVNRFSFCFCYISFYQ